MYNDNINPEKLQELLQKYSELKNSTKLISNRIFDNKKRNTINSCGDLIFFETWQHKHDCDDVKKRIKKSFLCRSKVCTFCNYLKSRKIGNQLYKIMIDLHSKGYEFSFLTLSAKNCKINKFKEEIKHLNHAWHKLTRKKFFKPFEFWFKAFEFTYNEKQKTFNPHFHVILAYNPKNYFKTSNYVSQKKFIDEWQQSLQCDYKPTAHIQKIKPKNKNKNSIVSAIAEVSKYPFKSCNMAKLSDDELNDVFFNQLKNVRFFTTSRNIKINDEIDKNDYFIDENNYNLIEMEIYKYSKNYGYKLYKKLQKNINNFQQKNPEKIVSTDASQAQKNASHALNFLIPSKKQKTTTSRGTKGGGGLLWFCVAKFWGEAFIYKCVRCDNYSYN